MFRNMTMKTRIFGVLGIFAIIAILSPTDEEEKNKIKNKMIALEEMVRTIPALEVNKNYEAYSKLSKYYKDNEEYKKKYNKYRNLEEIQTYCLSKSVSLNKKFLKNENTYSNEKYKFSKWISTKDYITNFSFTGKNAFGVEYNFNSQYKCTILKDGSSTIETIFIKQI